MGTDGEARIVHNCGVVYDKEGHERAVDAAPRVQLLHEIIEQATNKVIVFVPFRAPLEMLYREMSKDFKCAMVHGGVSKSQRATIFLEFQKNPELRVLLADAGTMSHGLTLTEANTSGATTSTSRPTGVSPAQGRRTISTSSTSPARRSSGVSTPGCASVAAPRVCCWRWRRRGRWDETPDSHMGGAYNACCEQ
jgi:hypothetical protein